MKFVILLLLPNLCFAAETNSAKQVTKMEKAIFAGGCFWCMEPPFEKVSGVSAVVSGYTGGSVPNPTYEQVSAGKTGHAEAVEITFDPEKVSYEELLNIFWHQINPLTKDQQFVDVGTQYRSAIFPQNAAQKAIAESSKKKILALGKFSKIETTIEENSGMFYPAEEYHQDYYKKNPIKYKFYRYHSGRDQFLEKTWGKN